MYFNVADCLLVVPVPTYTELLFCMHKLICYKCSTIQEGNPLIGMAGQYITVTNVLDAV